MKINFQPYTDEELDLIRPEPAIKHLPNWYKTLASYTHGKTPRLHSNGIHNLSAKKCVPMLDSLGAGYFIFLENTISVFYENEGDKMPKITWARGGDNNISTHSQEQINKSMIPDGYLGIPLKFTNYWSIQTPRGYSVLFTHPLNRSDLPFVTLSGIVDTDSYRAAVNFPFFLKEGFEGIIEAGTPIAQVIPFKREAWKSQIFPFDKRLKSFTHDSYLRRVIRYYKKIHWTPKKWL